MPADAIEVDDLIGYGHLGLLEARTRYDPTRRVPFDVYARHRIRGAIFDGIRQSLGPLRLRTYERLRRQVIAWRLVGEPAPPPRSARQKDLAADVTWNAIADLATALVAAQAEAQPGPVDPETRMLQAEQIGAVRAEVERLEPEHREALRAIYDLDGVGDSGADLARRQGLHRSSISRRHRAALGQLRRRLKDRPP